VGGLNVWAHRDLEAGVGEGSTEGAHGLVQGVRVAAHGATQACVPPRARLLLVVVQHKRAAQHSGRGCGGRRRCQKWQPCFWVNVVRRRHAHFAKVVVLCRVVSGGGGGEPTRNHRRRAHTHGAHRSGSHTHCAQTASAKARSKHQSALQGNESTRGGGNSSSSNSNSSSSSSRPASPCTRPKGIHTGPLVRG
jgi:hypothetical protein